LAIGVQFGMIKIFPIRGSVPPVLPKKYRYCKGSNK
jgi:hypothetical protein